MSERKIMTISIPSGKEQEIEDLKEVMKYVTDLAKIHNKKGIGKKYPETMAELLLFGMLDVCNKIKERLEGKASKEDFEKMENHRQYLREYYRDYRKKHAEKKVTKKTRKK